MNLQNIKIEMDKLRKDSQEETDALIRRGKIVNWGEYANREEELLYSYFGDIRESFLNQYTSLEAGRINSYLSQGYDSVSPSRYSHIEDWFINGWVVKDGQLDNGDYTRSINKTMLKYAEFLTNELSKIDVV